MKIDVIQILRIAARLCLALWFAGLTQAVAYADEYPSKPIRLIIPFSAGGSTDILARLIGPKLTKALGQAVVVDVKPGAASIIGSQAVAHAPPDGYTLLLTNVAFSINPALRGKDPPYELKDFTPITLLASQPTVLVLNSALRINSLQELVDLARKQPGELKYATAGIGSVGHMAAAIFQTATGVKMTHIPYQGGGKASVDVMSGVVMLGFLGAPPLLPYEKEGKVKFLALTDGRRSAALPGIPTLADLGLPGFSVDNWIGLLAPAGTPPVIVSRLFAEFRKVMNDPEIVARLTAIGFEPWVSESPTEFWKFLEHDIAKYASAAKAADVKLQ